MIYILHINPPLKHARHYTGWTKDDDVTRRVNEHLTQTGGRPSKLVGAALAAGCEVTLAGTMPGDPKFERTLKRRGSARKYCPLCRAQHNKEAAARMRKVRARRRLMELLQSGELREHLCRLFFGVAAEVAKGADHVDAR